MYLPPCKCKNNIQYYFNWYKAATTRQQFYRQGKTNQQTQYTLLFLWNIACMCVPVFLYKLATHIRVKLIVRDVVYNKQQKKNYILYLLFKQRRRI